MNFSHSFKIDLKNTNICSIDRTAFYSKILTCDQNDGWKSELKTTGIKAAERVKIDCIGKGVHHKFVVILHSLLISACDEANVYPNYKVRFVERRFIVIVSIFLSHIY